MHDPFASPLRKITRAYKQISNLEDAVAAFNQSNAYTHAVEPHPNGTHDIHKIVLIKPIPDEIEDLVADACG